MSKVYCSLPLTSIVFFEDLSSFPVEQCIFGVGASKWVSAFSRFLITHLTNIYPETSTLQVLFSALWIQKMNQTVTRSCSHEATL